MWPFGFAQGRLVRSDWWMGASNFSWLQDAWVEVLRASLSDALRMTNFWRRGDFLEWLSWSPETTTQKRWQSHRTPN